MPVPLFSDSWASSWLQAINRSERYRRDAATWEGSIVLRIDPDPAMGIPEQREVYADLWHGECRGIRPAAAEDISSAAYVICASPSDWRRILIEGADPLLALMRGRLRLAKGSLGSLLPYVAAAKELVAAAAQVPTEFPPEWVVGKGE